MLYEWKVAPHLVQFVAVGIDGFGEKRAGVSSMTEAVTAAAVPMSAHVHRCSSDGTRESPPTWSGTGVTRAVNEQVVSDGALSVHLA